MFCCPFVLYIRVIWVRGSKMRFDEDSAQNRRQKGNPRNDSTIWVPYCAMVKTCQNMSKHVLFSHTKRSFPHWWGSYKGIPNYGWDSLGLGPVTPIHAGMTILFCGEINQLLRRGLRIQRPRSSNPTHRWRESVTNCCEKSWINHRQQPWLSSISLSTSCNCWTSWTSPELKVLPSSQKSL